MKILLTFATALISQATYAATLVDSGEPDILGIGFSLYHMPATGFEFTSAVTVTGISSIFWGGIGNVRINLWNNDATYNLPGVLLQHADFDVTTPDFDTSWRGPSGLSWSLSAGKYWISFEDGYPDLAVNWGPASSPLSSAYTEFGNHYFRPTSLPKFALKVFGDAQSAVPEPASWALMIAGFGMVGGTLRSRRRKTLSTSTLES